MNEDNFDNSGKPSKPDETVPSIPMPPKILVELNPSVLEGHTLDKRFLIIRDLSKNEAADKGGIGLVYLAEDLKLLSKKVVIKILQDTASKNEDLARKFIHEKEALIRLDYHPNVVRILDSGTLSNGNPYIVLEYIHGYSLRLLLNEQKVLSFELCAHIIESITNALFAAHSKNILHRDVKPENIMLTPQEESFDHVRLIDFGIARVGNSRLAPATQIERGIGTVLYIAPEQLAGNIEQSPAADIYSCAIVAYEMLTGELPFAPHTMVEMFLLQEKGVKKMPRDLRPDIPEAAQRLILQALAFDPKSRPQNIRVFGRNLADSLRHVGDTQPDYKDYNHIIELSIPPDAENSFETRARLTAQNLQSEKAAENESLKMSVVTQTRPPVRLTANNQPAPEESSFTPNASNVAPKTGKNPMFYWLGGSLAVLLSGAMMFAGFNWLYKSGAPAGQNTINANIAAASNAKPPLQTSSSAALHKISYYLNVQKMRSGKPFEEPFRATGREIFESGYKFKMAFNATEDGYLYLFNEGKNAAGETVFSILYPVSKQKNSEQIKAGSEVETGYQVFSGGKGTEIVWLIWTKNENADLQEIKQTAVDSNGGTITEANVSAKLSALLQQYDESQNETIKDSANQTTTVGSSDDVIIHRLTLDHN